MSSRRDFLKQASQATAGLAVGGVLPGFSAKSYGRIIGANKRLSVAMMGVNSRGLAVGSNLAGMDNFDVMYVSDTDSRAADKFSAEIEKIAGKKPMAQPDFRKALEDKNLDVLFVTAPDHWHAPAAILGCQAGKHVYVEKPCSHNPHEGELLVAASKKYNRIVQMGNQRRSWPNVMAAIDAVRNGAIGNAYFAKCWYSANRKSIGRGKETAVPDWLNYDLWQGPAPRMPYRDNLIHYNWHWFWHWGTGEALNNGTHMVDLARWGLNVDYPTQVSSTGGRFAYNDDWQTPDTQIINLKFGSDKMISWEDRSCNGTRLEGDEVGVIFYGTKGSLVIGAGNNYKVYDADNNLLKEIKGDENIAAQSRVSPSQFLDRFHFKNFYDSITEGKPVVSEITEGFKSTLLMQLGNIAYRSGQQLNTDPQNGHIRENRKAMRLWARTYEKGWEPTL